MTLTTVGFGPQAGALEQFLDQIDDAPAERWLAVLQACRTAAMPDAWEAAWGAAWDAVRDAAREAACDAARGAVRDAVRDAAREAACDAALPAAGEAALAAVALLVRDLISMEHYDELTRVMRASGFVVHPDDEPLDSDES